ncbi:MAG TPA: hypothetical protein PLV09_04325 [Candidatus Omnitrophota bacterium]|nr:hypothetical protein [Candidatus Omnitrophota bacterium]HPN66626.1 hypothetical protein [Candidatus Omnitrophota bacterium]HRZ67074.1 hypothetical protein [Candidatus Omnitrophota bacterium]
MKKMNVFSVTMLVISFMVAGFTAVKAQKTEKQDYQKPRIEIEISRQVVDEQMKAYKGDLREIIKQADNNIRKIDAELKRKTSRNNQP